MTVFDLSHGDIRNLNQSLHALPSDPQANLEPWEVHNPNGQHAVAVGVDAPVTVNIAGHVGYYCGGMNKQATINIDGNAGVGAAENIMSGVVRISGDASQAAGATGHGGLLVIEGNASARCGISMKGVDIVVAGSVGHMSAFMAQKGRLVVLGDAGDGIGDSIYEAEIFVGGSVAGLGADCVEKALDDTHKDELQALLAQAGVAADLGRFRRFGSARNLYHFKVENVAAY